MPLYDTTNRLTSDKCFTKLRDSDNRHLSTYTFTNLRGKYKSDEQDEQDGHNETSGPDEHDESEFSDSDSCCNEDDSSSVGGNSDPYYVALKNRNLRLWDGYSVGPSVEDFFEDCDDTDPCLHRSRLFVASPYLGMHVPQASSTSREHNKDCVDELNQVSVRRGGGVSLVSKYHPNGARNAKIEFGPPRQYFCDSYLHNVSVGNNRIKYGDSRAEKSCLNIPNANSCNTNRIVDRLAEREWDRFDPVIAGCVSYKDDKGEEGGRGGGTNVVLPSDWIAGGAFSRDISRSPKFMKVMGYRFDGRTWKRKE
jgi:hypothetical protein